MSSTHIEINGKRYDARTGKLLATGGQSHHPDVKHSAHKPATKRPVHHPSKQVHSNQQRSNTLMRHAVKRPARMSAPIPSARSAVVDVAAPVQASARTNSPMYHKQDKAREVRAAKVKQSSLVSKFSDFSRPTAAPVQTRVEAMAVAPAPALTHKPVSSAAESMIAKGLRNANSHEQPTHHSSRKPRRGRGRLVSAVASGMAVLLLGAFITYQNIPNISMRYAAQRAGIAASLPGYQPSGFALNNKIKYNPGQITLSFQSNTDDREFTITQRESGWNSETLRSNYVASTEQPVQTYEDKGRTIYLYGSNATWVNGGVWYDIKGDSQLNSDQLIRIATSM